VLPEDRLRCVQAFFSGQEYFGFNSLGFPSRD
jgi:hypothetical protein